MSKNINKKTSIGGQAVIEGVMMRGESSMATAVRDEDGIIRIESKRIKSVKNRKLFFRLPIIRGVVAFIDSLVGGTKTLMRSAEVYGESEPSNFEKWLSKKFKIDIMSVVITFSLVISFALAIGLFIIIPMYSRKLLGSIFGLNENLWFKNITEGLLKIIIFILYIVLCSFIKDVKRTFMYHGAEHKTISCFESGKPLTIENAKKCTRVHNRCGTTFIVFVMVISILTFACFEAIVGVSIDGIYRILLKIFLLPLVAGLSYELLKGLAKTDSKWVYPLKVPGLLLQRITTKEPTDDMLEVAITAFNTVLEMDKDRTLPTKQFIISEKCKDLTNKIKKTLKDNGIEEDAEAEWIVSILANIKRDDVYLDKLIRPIIIEKINKVVNERITGRPLWYCLGDTNFYGYTIKVDERVLIPRPETELLVLEAKKYIKNNSRVLDLCTGSGAIAIAINKETKVKVIASDISNDALVLAKENAKLNNAEIEFIESDMFLNLGERKFDVIISNPPYIKKDEIETLQREVKNFEPKIALDGGVDGLDYYRNIAKNCKNHLNNGGILLLECGDNQADLIKEMLVDFSKVEVIKDLENIDRIVKAVL